MANYCPVYVSRDSDGDDDDIGEDYDYDQEISVTSRRSVNEKQRTRDLYMKACDMCGAMPVPQFYKHTQDSKINLKNCSIGDIGVKPVAISLVNDIYVQHLDLEDNGISQLGSSYLSQMLTENITLTHLNLAENCLGSQGARVFRDVMTVNRTITHLNLSGNGFNENDAIYFSEILEKNRELIELNLSHNAFSEIGGQLLHHGVVENNTLESLDLSWNHLRKTGAIAICKALGVNGGLLRLNLEWNGLGSEGAKQLGLALADNGRLIDLNISANRICFEGLALLIHGLAKNTTLESLKVRNNPILKTGATALMNVLLNSEYTKLRNIDISDIAVDEKFMEVFHKVKSKHPDATISFGRVLIQNDPAKRIYDIVETPEDPLAIFFEQMRFNGFRLVDFFNRIDKDKNFLISREELSVGFDGFDTFRNASISQSTVDKVMVKLDKDRNGLISFDELVAGHKAYKQMMRRKLNPKNLATPTPEPTDEAKLKTLRVKVKTLMDQRQLDVPLDADIARNSLLSPGGARSRTGSGRPRTPRR